MVGQIRQFITPGKVARPTLSGQLAFTTLVNLVSGLLWWAVSGAPWVAVMTLSSQAGGPALIALIGRLARRREWSAPSPDYNPRRVAVWAYFTGALLAACALLMKQSW